MILWEIQGIGVSHLSTQSQPLSTYDKFQIKNLHKLDE